MKKSKYYLSVEGYECTLVDDTEITKSKFEKMLKDLKKAVKETEDYEMPTEMNYFEFDNEKYVRKVWVCRSGGCEVILAQHECKEGYCFITKKRG